jgi:hypothetical protein
MVPHMGMSVQSRVCQWWPGKVAHGVQRVYGTLCLPPSAVPDAAYEMHIRSFAYLGSSARIP